MLKLSQSNVAAFKKQANDDWLSSTVETLKRQYADYFLALDVQDTALEQICQETRRWAGGKGIHGRRDVSKLCVATVSLGHRFWRDRRFEHAMGTTLGNPELETSEAISQFMGFTSTWLASLWQDDDLAKFGERLAHQVAANAVPSDHLLREILPGHWRLFDDAQNAQIIAWLVSLTQNPQPRGRELAFVAGALAHGVGWFYDPQYTRITSKISETSDPYALGAEVYEIYGAMK